MADDYMDCQTNALTIKTIFESLFSQDANGTYYFRVVEGTASEGVQEIDCEEQETWEQLFRKALCLADDGRMALRTVSTDFANGVNLTDVPECGRHEDLWIMLKRSFVLDSDGNVAFNLANIT